MELIKVSIDKVKPYERNARKNDEAVKAVVESIKQCEYVAPIVVDENYVILCGHTRLKALKQLGYTEVEICVKSGLTDEQKRKYRLLDNKTNEIAEWDFDLLAEELDGLDFGELQLDWGVQFDENYGTDFSLPAGDKGEFETMTFTLHTEQAGLLREALEHAKPEIVETFGNTNNNGNALYEIIRQWELQRI